MGERACCLDQESGLYHFRHFKSALARELARLDRWERPLSLALIEAEALNGAAWAALGDIISSSLRPIDLAARLKADQAAVIMPDAEGRLARRWLSALFPVLEKAGFDPLPRCGLALARPWEGRTADDLMRAAANRLGADPLESEEDGADFTDYSVTAIAADERSLLFAGFQALGASPGT